MIYILLPVFNEEKNLEKLFEKIQNGMQRRGFKYQAIVYNDGSSDKSQEILSKLAKIFPITILGKPQNEGLGVAFLNLLKEIIRISDSEEDIAVVLDSDNSHNPEHIYQMVNKIHDGFDVVIASRYLTDSRIVGVSHFRKILSFFASVLMRILFPIEGVKDYTCGYRAYSISILKRVFQKFGENTIEERGFACMAEFLIKLRVFNLLAVEIPLVLRYDQKGGESKMNILATVKKTILMLIRLFQIK
ncbi:MAG: glycosyltransferase family 2 protein [Candidatus Riflebacteria bacterium]|nr:glycosyltransferase family 2 protein [Candidatus Riflebacteria bacterium]